jgi:Ca-activated chloride channel homolog
MKINRLMPSLTLMALVCLYPGLSQEYSPEVAPDKDHIWYRIEEPGNADRLVAKGQTVVNLKNNSLSIVEFTGLEKRISLEIPAGNWASLEIAPSIEGILELYCLYPTGSVTQILSASVNEGKIYRAYFHAEMEGDYEVWYSIKNARSDSVRFNVQKFQVDEGPSMPSIAKTGGAMPMMSYSARSPATSIGFSTGGAKDINNFRENIKHDYLPLPTDVTYEGLFYDYYFETGAVRECQKLFCPAYSYAVSRDPISGELQYYLSVGLNSGIKDFKRKKLNLVVVLDYSGSMGSPFDQYYYDRFGNKVELEEKELGKTKMQIADESVVALLGHLKPEDRFGLVTFSDDAFLVDPLTKVADKDLERLKSRIIKIKEAYGTRMEAGMEKGTASFDRFLQADKSEYENRIIFLTDAMPNMGETGDLGLFRMLADNADQGIYTTFIGVGVDFNTKLVEEITKIKGANYYSVHSATEFKKRMDDEFDYMVTPLVFDLKLKLDAPGYEIEKVYGSPESDQATGEIVKVNTLFPSKSEENQVKGGVILVKLKKLSSEGDLRLLVSYEDRNGVKDDDEAKVELEDTKSDFYQNTGIRKAILLSRYADLLKNWMIDERKAQKMGWKVVPSVTLANGIVIPVELGEWERQSLPLRVSEPYRELFSKFLDRFQESMKAIDDPTLGQEVSILEKLRGYTGLKQNN